MSQAELPSAEAETNPRTQHPPEITEFLKAGRKTKAYIIVKAIVGPQACDDAYGEIVVKILENYHTRNPEKSLNAWIRSLARNHAIDFSKKLATRRRREKSMSDLPDVASDQMSEAEHGEKDQETEALLKLLDKWVYELPLKYREPLMLYYSGEMTFQEIAELTKASESTVRTRIHRAEIRLKTLAKEQAKKLAVFSMTVGIDYDHVANLTQQAIDKFYGTPKIAEAVIGTATAGAAVEATQASWFGLGNWSLSGIINAIGFPLFWLSSLFIGGRLAARQIMDHAPSLYARRWIIKHITVVYCMMLAYPVYMAVVHATLQYLFLHHQYDQLATTAVNSTYFIGFVLYLGWLGDRSNTVMNGTDAKPPYDESQYSRLRRNIFNLLLFLSFLLGGVYVWLYFEVVQPNIDFLRKEMQPERLCALIGLIVGMLLALWFHVKTIRSFRYFFSISENEQVFQATKSKSPWSFKASNTSLYVIGILTLLPGIGLLFAKQPRYAHAAVEIALLLLVWKYIHYRNQKDPSRRMRRIMGTLLAICIAMMVARDVIFA